MVVVFFFLVIRRPPRSTQGRSSAASDVYKRQELYKKNQQLGPWTDIYGLGASMYACMVGAPPQAADQRAVHDKVDVALQGVQEHYSRQLLDLVHWCMKINPLERPQSVFSLQRALREPPEVPKSRRSMLPFRWLGGVSFRKRRVVSGGDTTALWPTQKSEA